MKTATQVYDWLYENIGTFMGLRKSTLSTLLYLLGGVTKGQLQCIELCDSDFPAFNDILALPKSETHILPFIDWQTEEWQYDPGQRICIEKGEIMQKETRAQEVAKLVGLTKATIPYEHYVQSELRNDDLIDQIQDFATGCYDDVLFVMSDGSCINRQGDEYFLNMDVDRLDPDYLKTVGYL